jgi:hypothetical protein
MNSNALLYIPTRIETKNQQKIEMEYTSMSVCIFNTLF